MNRGIILNRVDLSKEELILTAESIFNNIKEVDENVKNYFKHVAEIYSEY